MMMKRILSLLLAMMLLCGLSAGAEGDPYAMIEDALYRIVLRTEAEDVTLGTGVVFIDQNVLLTAESCFVEGTLYAIGSDGEHAILNRESAGNAGVILLEMATNSSAQPVNLARLDASTLPYLFGTDANGNIGSLPLYQALHGMYRGQESVVFSGAEGLLPGAVVLDAKGGVIGMVVAQKMEGIGMYAALDVMGIHAGLTGQNNIDAFLDVETNVEDGMLTISWQDQTRDSGVYLVTISGQENNYYTFYEAEPDVRSVQMAVPPGHNYCIQVQWAENAENAVPPAWSAMTLCEVAAEPFTEYGFTQECYLASARAGDELLTVLEEVTFVSVDTLADASVDYYLQILNTYDVSEEIRCAMTLELVAPDGQFYFEELGYVFSPEYEAADYFTLQADRLFEASARFTGGVVQPGEYTLRYAIGGKAAGETTFTVEAAGTPIPEKTTDAPIREDAGILTNISAEYRDGCVHVDWSGCTVPEGAAVTAYMLYDGNDYFTYYAMDAGKTEVDFHAVPGRMCMVWVGWAYDGTNALYPDQKEEYLILLPEAGTPYTEYGFTNVRCGLTVTANADPEGDGVYLPQVAITREALADPAMKLIFQTEDTYQVTAESLQHPLAFVLYTPEGYVFVEPGYYNFDPKYNASDLWVKDLTDVKESYVSLVGDAAWPAGEYKFGYYIDGQVAAEITFILE